MADLKIIISSLNKAGGDIAKLKGDIKGVGDAGTQAKGGVKGFGDGIGSVLSKAALAAGAVAAVGMAIKQVYEVTKEAAELDYARSKFDMLSESIGTTSTALLVDLRAATAGLVSDAELIDGAGQMMALGLATTHDEAVRLATVAGELGMNMNQLVLTLTNKTTMRFDTLGVSVAGFDEKVKALEATGMSADKAFSEAFLQQAEEQISKVGRVADSSVGSFKLMEAGIKNLGDAAKANLLDILEPALAGIAGYLSEQGNVAQAERSFKKLAKSMDDALIPSTKFRQEVYKLTAGGVISSSKLGEFNELFEYYSNQVKIAEEGTQSWADANYDGAVGMAAAEAAALAQTLATEEMTEVAIAAAEAQAKLNAELANITTLDNNYKGIIDLGYKYTDILKEITVQEKIMAEEPIGSEKYEEAKGKVKELQGAMDDLANRVTLDMFQATIAIGGVTEAELSAYMQMAIDMGFMSEEGAQAAMDAYGNAIATINGYEIDEKTGNVVINAEEAYATLVMIQQMQIADKNANINIFTHYYNTTHGYDPYENYTGPGGAVGMAVNAGEPYIWQEYGYRGERFVPSADGFIMSRADAERALSKALMTGAGDIDPEAIGKAIAKAMSGVVSRKDNGNVYNLTMPTSSNPADVRTAFELMEAWA